MEMCYDGTLVMPQNFSVVTADEMEYVDGGGWLFDLAVNILGKLVYKAISMYGYDEKIVKAAVGVVVSSYAWVSAAVTAASAWVIANPVVAFAALSGLATVITVLVLNEIQK